MANHVRCRLISDTNVLKFIKSTHNNELIDFSKIIAMPVPFEVTQGSESYKCISAALADMRQRNNTNSTVSLTYVNTLACLQGLYPEITFDAEVNTDEASIASGQGYLQQILKYYNDIWYEWRLTNWGTKWNAFDSEQADDTTILFSTAWSAPFSVIEKLAEKFPDVTITLEWADEDIGYNAGCVIFKGDEDAGGYDENESKEAFERGADLWCLDLAEEGFKYNPETKTYSLEP